MSAPTSIAALSPVPDGKPPAAHPSVHSSLPGWSGPELTREERSLEALSHEEMRRLDKTEIRRLTEQLLRRMRDVDRESETYGRLRAVVVALNTALVHYVARGFGRRRAPYDDIFQTGTVGLLKAIDGYDVDRGSEFASFALPTISGEIKRFFRDTSWGVHVTRTLQERFLAVTRAVHQLEQELSREPTASEIAACLDMDVKDVREARDAGRAYMVDSIDAAPGGNDPSGRNRTPLAELLPYEEREIALVDFRESVKPLLSALPRREQMILEMRFWQDMPQREIGERLGVSQMHISRLLNGTLSRLREQLESDGPARRFRKTAA
ncbi:SigB/SigF/SigG family RNA polymerase sigma factor [Yinghuangia sp. ASG 101]|uniref:SigB/SigF/SigG family RNA polymerase sigma factor n=1 Tax=Yinghuangia sp. ASG 101 TaxID=2896848 RepID=UPI001E3261B4|nr:SigB/SigF/SigG family RNA polymerase sigma factor [Yinghuangia sp. ASG 101]UGQ10316.1 SigB/SigF/SigG family RNA polymerase sigma factor [Yinghuangia sp. ASG 101]